LSEVQRERRLGTLTWVLLAAGLAVILGVASASVIRAYLDNDREFERSRLLAVVSHSPDSIFALGTGDTLTDHVFEDLEEQPVRLSDLVVGNMLISVVMPTCESCLDEMLYIRDQIDNPKDYRHLVFITSANPRFMRDIKEETGLTAAFLYDHRAEYLSRYDVQAYPFNIIIDSNMVVLDIFGGGLTQTDLAKVLE
jgi:hypothetical protein